MDKITVKPGEFVEANDLQELREISVKKSVVRIGDKVRERRPIVYDYERGLVMYPSVREMKLVEGWCKTFSYVGAIRYMEAEGLGGISQITAKRWLERETARGLIGKILKERAECEGYTRDKWMSDGLRIQREVEVPMTRVIAWKEMGRACGYYEGGNVMNNFGSIQFVQANGKA